MKKHLLMLIFILAPAWIFAQGWVGNGANQLRTVNSTLSPTPVQVGIGVVPSARLHVSLTDIPAPLRSTQGIRFFDLAQNNTFSRVLVTDASGNVVWRDVSTIGTGNEWLLTGNLLTNPVNNFLGTRDPQHLVFRTNDLHRILITSGPASQLPGSTGGFVGIGLGGLNLPATRVHANGGLLFTGNALSAPISTSIGVVQRMMWHPNKAAFRSGTVTGTQWDDGPGVGINSVAIGLNTSASGPQSFAGGNLSSSSGTNSFAFGIMSNASGLNSFGLGQQTNASGNNSYAFGNLAEALSNTSFALGNRVRTTASANNAFVIGNGTGSVLINNIANSMMVGFNSNIPTLFVGPSAGDGLTGDVGIGTTTPTKKLDVNGEARIEVLPSGSITDSLVTADAFGNLRWIPVSLLGIGTGSGSCWDCSSSPGNTYLSNPTDNVGVGITPLTKFHVEGGGLFRGSSADPALALGAGQRMHWYSTKAAFRAGTVSGNQWDDFNIGQNSFATGNNTLAIGQNSFAAGDAVVASGINSSAFGSNTTASGNSSFVTGNLCSSSGDYSFISGAGNFIASNGNNAAAFGNANYANGNSSFVAGSESQSTGNTSTAMGYLCYALANNSIATGYICEASGDGAFAQGRFLKASGFNSAVYGVGGNTGLVNNIAKSFMIGTGSDAASLYVGPSPDPTTGTGDVGIGTSSPNDKLDVNGNAVPHNSDVFDLGTSAFHWRDIYLTNSPTITSDARLKQNVQGLAYGISEIKRLRPVSYVLNSNPTDTKLGLIAQETREVISEVVKEGNDLNKTLGIQYSDLIPVLIKGIQEQQAMIETLEAKIETLENNSFAPSSEKTLQTISGMMTEVVKIYQNNPNPFDETTEIKYFIPEQVSDAKLYIYNLTGTELKSIGITERGTGAVQINAGEFAAGMYLYTIIADDQETETKRMILTK